MSMRRSGPVAICLRLWIGPVGRVGRASIRRRGGTVLAPGMATCPCYRTNCRLAGLNRGIVIRRGNLGCVALVLPRRGARLISGLLCRGRNGILSTLLPLSHDFFGAHVGCFVAKQFHDFWGHLHHVSAGWRVQQLQLHASENSSLFSIRSNTTLTAPWSTLLTSLSLLSRKIFGAMTVAMFHVSILLPVSSSTVWNDDTQFRKQKSTSMVSRWALGSKHSTKCSTFFRWTSS